MVCISYRLQAFASEVLLDLNLEANSDDVVFDNQMLSQIIFKGYEIGGSNRPDVIF